MLMNYLKEWAMALIAASTLVIVLVTSVASHNSNYTTHREADLTGTAETQRFDSLDQQLARLQESLDHDSNRLDNDDTNLAELTTEYHSLDGYTQSLLDTRARESTDYANSMAAHKKKPKH